jgi:hypothetical protein
VGTFSFIGPMANISGVSPVVSKNEYLLNENI